MNTLLQSATEVATLGSIGLAAYHHVGYPALLRFVRKQGATPVPQVESALPSMTIVMPAFNEADYIVQKLRNIAALDYPAHRLEVIIVCDGCTDATVALARATLAERNCEHLCATVVDCTENRGKVAALNDGISQAHGEIMLWRIADAKPQA